MSSLLGYIIIKFDLGGPLNSFQKNSQIGQILQLGKSVGENILLALVRKKVILVVR